MSAFLWAAVAACIWGIVPLMEKAGLSGTTAPFAGVMVRSIGVAAGLLVLSCVWSPWAMMRAMGWRSILLLALGGFLASVVGQLAFYRALKSGALSQVVPVAGAYPLVAALLGWLLLREPITVPRFLGLILVVSGVWLLRT